MKACSLHSLAFPILTWDFKAREKLLGKVEVALNLQFKKRPQIEIWDQAKRHHTLMERQEDSDFLYSSTRLLIELRRIASSPLKSPPCISKPLKKKRGEK